MHAEAQRLLDLARQVRRSGDRVTSLQYFQDALALAPDQNLLKVEAATDLRELGRLDEAEAAYQEVLQGKPHHFGALFGLGYVARRRGDRAAAVAWFQAAATADSSQLTAKMEAATDLRELGRLDEAEAAYQEVLQG
ncbi:tetratricopeptide repeat protein, partial [Microvirga sp. BT689]|uniref:tetratricopeptide repeat protein n=1 Tax=Microvirga arvi TaxID=2778731 RepID=UPI00195259CC|nr:tetratricopeptide repeat protein [Microvirga arvi]